MNPLEQMARRLDEIERRLKQLTQPGYWSKGLHTFVNPLTSTSWDGDGHSTTAKTLIPINSTFTNAAGERVPTGAKMILVRAGVEDEAGAANECYLILSPNDTAGSGIFFSCFRENDSYNRPTHEVPCNSDGNVFYQVLASGANTLDVIIQIHGYWM